MTTTEKIKELQKEVQLLRKLVQSNDDAIYAQKQVMSELYRQIDHYQSFIRTNNLY